MRNIIRMVIRILIDIIRLRMCSGKGIRNRLIINMCGRIYRGITLRCIIRTRMSIRSRHQYYPDSSYGSLLCY